MKTRIELFSGRTRSLTVAALFCLTNIAAAQNNWPQFRGAHARGVAEDHPTPTKWNLETGENIKWKTPIPGLAHSSPIVWGDKLFVTTAVSSDPNPRQTKLEHIILRYWRRNTIFLFILLLQLQRLIVRFKMESKFRLKNALPMKLSMVLENKLHRTIFPYSIRHSM